MPNQQREKIVYVTSSRYKINENKHFVSKYKLSDGTTVKDRFEFDIRQVNIKESLEVDIAEMVTAEVKSAYSQVRVPCIVEHAGLIFEGQPHYPGGLTKPMWNALQENFISETHSKHRRAIARAVVAYCDGQKIKTFVGETQGRISDIPKGSTHKFYWDTIFIPDDPSGKSCNKTYAEIVEDKSLGLKYKVLHLSQSTRAMAKFMEYRLKYGTPELWSN